MKRLVKVVLAILGVLFLYSLWKRIPDVDDAWLGEQAYWLAKLGYVKSELMRGINHQEIRILLYHKLFIAIGAGVVKVFGFNLYVLKSISLVFLGLFFFIFYRFTVHSEKIFSNFEFLLASLIIFVNPLVFKLSFVFRPEIMLMTLSFASYILVYKSLKTSSRKHALFAGLIGGLCMLTHLNGIGCIIAGLALFVWYKRYKSAMVFTGAAFVISCFYLYDFNAEYNFDFWYSQLNKNPHHELSFGLELFNKVLSEHKRFFHSPKESLFAILFIVTLLASFKKIKDKHQILLRYTLILIIVIAIISISKTSKYALIYIPYLAIVLVEGLKYLFNNFTDSKAGFKKVASLRNFILLALFSYVAIGFYHDAQLAFTKNESLVLDKSNFTEPTDELNIIAPMTSIFEEIENFNRIQSELCFADLHSNNNSIYGEGFLARAAEDEVYYIILSPTFQEELGLLNYEQGHYFKDYHVIDRQSQLLWLKKNAEN